MNPIKLNSASKPNQSQDLRLLDMLINGYKDFGPRYSKMSDNIKKTKDIHSLIDKVVFDHTFYTKEILDSGLSKSKINNVTDAFLEIRKLMRHPDNMEFNNLVYSVYKRKLLGEMHVYDDRPLEFIPA
jgi:L-rhamnose isomerase